MFTQVRQEYAGLSDGELLQLASERAALTDDAKAALDAEMRGRNLSVVDIKNHARFVKKIELRETRGRGRKLFGIRVRVPQKSGVEIVVALFWIGIAISLILLGYFALPARYRLPADWQEATGYAMFNFVFIAVWFFRDWGRRLGFWVSLLIASTAHALIVHSWIVRFGTDMLWRNRSDNRVAGLLGLFLFFLLYGCGSFLHRKFYGKETGP